MPNKKTVWVVTAVGALLVILITASVVHIGEARQIGPAKAAVLAIKADLDGVSITTSNDITAPVKAPNIIIILADDMGWRDVGYNESEIRTPVIDRLAATGITLNRFYVQPSCSPTRAALMTGKSPMRLGILNPLSKNNPTGLPLTERTLADRLKTLGYQTALIGKWHLGPRNLAYHPNARGFDHFYGHLTGGIGYYDKVHGGGYDWQRNGETVRDAGYTTSLIAGEAVKLIKQRAKERPLFLYIAFGAPHLPNEAPEASIGSYSNIKDKRRRIHAAMVTELDSAIGDIYAALLAEGIEQDTLIWFMSDNGGLFPSNPVRYLPEPFFTWALESRLALEATPKFVDFVRTNLRDGGADNRPFSGGKQSVAEGGVRVPAFIHWPGQFAASHYDYMATVQDVVPTLLTVSGETPDAIEFDGRSLWAALKTNTPAPQKEYIVQTRQFSEINAVYRYPYKLVEDGSDQKLYDLEADPLETKNIAQRKPALVAELASYLATFPRGENIALPLEEIVNDPDYFGGEEDRAPWADRAYGAAVQTAEPGALPH